MEEQGKASRNGNLRLIICGVVKCVCVSVDKKWSVYVSTRERYLNDVRVFVVCQVFDGSSRRRQLGDQVLGVTLRLTICLIKSWRRWWWARVMMAMMMMSCFMCLFALLSLPSPPTTDSSNKNWRVDNASVEFHYLGINYRKCRFVLL